MGNSSSFSTFLTAMLVVVAAVGLYFVIDSHSIAAQQSAKVDQTLQRIADRIERVEKRLERMSLPLDQGGKQAERSAGALERIEKKLDASVGTLERLNQQLGRMTTDATSDKVSAPASRMVKASPTTPEADPASEPSRDVPATPRVDPDDSVTASEVDPEDGVSAKTEAENVITPDSVPDADGAMTVAAGENGVAFFANDDLRDFDADDGDARIGYTTALPGQLNTIILSEATASSIWGQCHASLAERNLASADRFEPILAESWTRSADGLVYTIRLRDTFRWQSFTDPATGREYDARPVTAHDFTFFWEVLQNPDVPCDPLRSYYEFVENIEALDDYTVRVTWREPYSLAEAFTLGLSPLARHLYRPEEEAGLDDKTWAEQFIASPRNQIVVGTGPYRLAWFDGARGYRLERDENYGGRKPHLKALETRLIADQEVALNDFKNGRLDAIGLTPVQWTDQTPAPDYNLVTPDASTAEVDSAAHDLAKRGGLLSDRHRFEKYQYAGTAWTYLGYNLRRPLFADREVRQALTMLVDRERILREVNLGLGRIISGPFVPQNPAYDASVAPWPFDPERAKAQLARAGWSDTDGDGVLDRIINGKSTPFRFTLIIPSASVNARKIAAIVEQDFQKAGVAMEIKPLEWSVYVSTLDNWDFDACCLAWVGGLDSDPYQIWHSSQADKKQSSNFIGFKSEAADRLIEEGRSTINAERRNAIYHQFHQLLHEEQPYTFLIAGTNTLALSRRYRNLRVFPLGMDPSLHWVPTADQRTP